MDKCIYDENNGLSYELQGDDYIPCFTLPVKKEKHIGIWGQRHRRYLQWQRRQKISAAVLLLAIRMLFMLI